MRQKYPLSARTIARPERGALSHRSARGRGEVNHARTSRSRNGPPRLARPWKARASSRSRRAGRDLRWPLPKNFVGAARRQDRARARPPRQISPGRSVVRRRAADASRHVGLVPCRQATARGRTPGDFTRALASRRARPCGVSHVAGATVTFNDPRRFGFMKLVAARRARQEPLLQLIGPEPLGNAFDAAMLARACRARRRRSRRRCATRASSPGSATSMSARRCTAR